MRRCTVAGTLRVDGATVHQSFHLRWTNHERCARRRPRSCAFNCGSNVCVHCFRRVDQQPGQHCVALVLANTQTGEFHRPSPHRQSFTKCPACETLGRTLNYGPSSLSRLACTRYSRLTSGQPCWSGTRFGWTDHAAGLSPLSASASSAVACTLPGAW